MKKFDKMVAEVPDSTLDKYLEEVGKVIRECGITPDDIKPIKEDEVPPSWVISSCIYADLLGITGEEEDDEVPECWVIWDTVEEEEIAWDESRAALENLLDAFEVRVWKDFPEMWNGPDEFRKRFIICKHPEV